MLDFGFSVLKFMSLTASEKTACESLAPVPQHLMSGTGADAEADVRTPLGWLLSLTGMAVLLRAIGLNQQLWYDEIVTLVNSVRQPIGTILTTYTSQNQHTLYSILTRGCVALLGEHPWALRLPALMFGVASVPMLYLFARLICSRREALLASAMMTVSYHQVWFSQNARGYTAMLFWTLLATYCFSRGAKESAWGPWVGYAVAMALGMYTHLTMAFVAAAHGLVYLCLLMARRSLRFSPSVVQSLMGFLMTGVLTLALYFPLLPQLFARTVGQAGRPVRWEWKNPLWMIQETLRGLEVGAGGTFVAIAIAGLLALAGLVSFWRRDHWVVGLMILPGVVTGAAMFALEHNLWPRFFFFAIGFVFLFLARGAMVSATALAGWLGRDAQVGLRWGTALVILMLATSLWSLPAAYRLPKQDFVGAMELVDSQRAPGEPVVTVGLTSFVYQPYFGRSWQAVETYGELESVLVRGQRTWLVYGFPIYLKSRYPEIWTAIQTQFETVRVFRGTLGGGEIYVCEAGVRAESRPVTR